jgi:hypothetical protein
VPKLRISSCLGLTVVRYTCLAGVRNEYLRPLWAVGARRALLPGSADGLSVTFSCEGDVSVRIRLTNEIRSCLRFVGLRPLSVVLAALAASRGGDCPL